MIVSAFYAIYRVFDFPHWMVDDAYINLRYSENLLRHGELNWNPGQDPVEGYTGIGVPALVAIIGVAGIKLVTAAHMIGVGSYFVTLALMIGVLRRANTQAFIIAGAVASFVAIPTLVTHAWSGLETPLFMAATLLILFVFLRWSRGAHAITDDLSMIIPLLFICLVRPEGIVFAATFSVAMFANTLRTHEFRRFATRWLLLFAVPLTAYYAGRTLYYGYPLPNTYYVKTSTSSSWIKESTLQLRKFLGDYGMVPLIAIVAAVFVWLTVEAISHSNRRLHRAPQRPRDSLSTDTNQPALAVGLVALCLAFGMTWVVYARSELMMDYSYRFWVPILPTFIITTSIVIDRGIRRAAARNIVAAGIIATIGVVAAVVHTYQIIDRNELQRETEFAATYLNALSDEHVRLGAWLATSNAPDLKVAVFDAGAVPFFSRFETLDLYRLNDEYRAHHPGISGDALVTYLIDWNPDIIVDQVGALDRPSRLLLSPVQSGQPYSVDSRLAAYRVVAILSSSAQGWADYKLIVYARRSLDLPEFPARRCNGDYRTTCVDADAGIPTTLQN